MTGRIERIQKAFEVDIRWTAFPLHPDTPEQGKTLEELFKGRNIDIEQMLAHLKQVAKGLGLPFGDRSMTYNSRLAQELGKWAESIGKGHEFHNAMFRAYFKDGQNIGKTDVLIEVAESIHLSGKDALQVIQVRTYKEAVDADWQRSYELRVNAVPTFLFAKQVLVGAQKYESLETLMLSNHVNRRTLDS
ncbi:MAG: DsbA family protein [Desulfobacterales bacterium]|nr:MAG: DsbA family protein [Desulfobacterales bacterium]UCD91453.1 MAG: DsbA family protein [Desulfobacterales bacterium]